MIENCCTVHESHHVFFPIFERDFEGKLKLWMLLFLLSETNLIPYLTPLFSFRYSFHNSLHVEVLSLYLLCLPLFLSL